MQVENWFLEHLLNPLGLFGLAAQAMFMLRFVVQWFASEKRGRSYVPVVFWYISLLGGAMLFTYASFRKDPVIMLGQALGMTIYLRNLALIYRRKAQFRRRSQRGFEVLPDDACASKEAPAETT